MVPQETRLKPNPSSLLPKLVASTLEFTALLAYAIFIPLCIGITNSNVFPGMVQYLWIELLRSRHLVPSLVRKLEQCTGMNLFVGKKMEGAVFNIASLADPHFEQQVWRVSSDSSSLVLDELANLYSFK